MHVGNKCHNSFIKQMDNRPKAFWARYIILFSRLTHSNVKLNGIKQKKKNKPKSDDSKINYSTLLTDENPKFGNGRFHTYRGYVTRRVSWGLLELQYLNTYKYLYEKFLRF